MENLRFDLATSKAAGGDRPSALTGVVASGNLEVLMERSEAAGRCIVEIATVAHGFKSLWEAVFADFNERHAAGGLRISINDGGARPDIVSLRLAQGLRLIEGAQP